MTYPAGLSERHVQILGLLAEGLDNGEIGARLSVAENTVKSHLQTMAKKTGIGDRAGMVAWGFREGLLHVPAARSIPPELAEFVLLARRVVAWADAQGVNRHAA